MAQTSLNSTGVASTGALSLQSNGTTEAIGISTGQVATLAQNPILTSGTANGVPYLNGSKVLTSGSALTFDGTNLYNSGRTGLGVANTSGPTLKIDKLSGSDQLSFYESGVDLWHVYTSASGLGFYYNPGASEIMRLTSTGLGIGTSSPASRLTSKASANNYSSGALALQGSVSGTTYLTNAGGTFYISNDGSTDHLVMSSSGNLGLGVTPSAWASSQVALQTKGGAITSGSTTELNLWTNAYYNAGSKYVGNGYATLYSQSGGVHAWSIAGNNVSGAGAAITFTQALTLDASGKLLVGLTSSGSTNAVLQTNGPANFKGYTVSTLPSGTVGDRAYVTDAVTAVFQAIPTGGGSVKTPVFFNGSNWVCG